MGAIRASDQYTQQLQAALQHQQERLAALELTAQLGSWEYELATQQLSLSAALCQLYGLPAGCQLTPQAWLEQVHSAERPAVQQALEDYLTTGKPYSLDYRIITLAGEVRWVQGRSMVGLGHGRYGGTVQDITARMEQALKAAQDHAVLQEIFDQSTDALFLVDFETKLTLEVNKRALELFEADNLGQLLGIYGSTLQARDFTPEEWLAVEAYTATDKLYEQQMPYRTLKGKLFWGSLAFRPIYLHQQRKQLVRVRDITAELEAEAAHKRLHALFGTVLHNAPIVLTVLDAEGNYVFREGKGLQLLGISNGQGVGQNIFTLYPDNPGVALLRQALQGKAVHPFIYTLDTRQFEMTVTPLKDAQEKISGLVVVALDVTERLENELRFRQSEERFRRFFNDAHLGIYVTNADGYFTEVNRALCLMLGYTEEELHNLTFLDITHPDDLMRQWSMTEGLLYSAVSTYQIEKRFLRKDGQVIWVSLTTSSVFDFKGDALYRIHMAEDITARKAAEARLHYNELVMAQTRQLAGLCFWELELNTGNTVWSAEAHQLLQLPKTAQPTLVQLLQQAHPKDKHLAQELLQTAAAGKPYQVTLRIITQQGPVRWLLFKGEPYSKAGQEGYTINFIQDITDQHQG